MIKSPKSNIDKATGQPRSAAILLLITIADTTWRAFVPTIGGTLFGVWLDHAFNTVPYLTFTMVVVGFTASALLINMQLKSVRATI